MVGAVFALAEHLGGADKNKSFDASVQRGARQAQAAIAIDGLCLRIVRGGSGQLMDVCGEMHDNIDPAQLLDPAGMFALSSRIERAEIESAVGARPARDAMTSMGQQRYQRATDSAAGAR